MWTDYAVCEFAKSSNTTEGEYQKIKWNISLEFIQICTKLNNRLSPLSDKKIDIYNNTKISLAGNI